MTRLVLAIVIVAVLILGITIFALGYRAVASDGASQRDESSAMQKVAYALLVGLMLYVAFQGGA